MYLSKITPDFFGRLEDVIKKLGKNGVYSEHQVLWKLFPQEAARSFIYRQETDLSGSPAFFVLSRNIPTSLDNLFCIQTKSFKPKLEKGQRLAFKLRANPTICFTDENGHQQRHDVLMHEKRTLGDTVDDPETLRHHMEQAAIRWFCDEQRLSQWGFCLESIPDIESYRQHRCRSSSGHQIQFSSVDFQGILTVTEPDQFLSAYAKGFGRSKSLGCGLMLIRRI